MPFLLWLMEIAIGSIGAHVFIGTLLVGTKFQLWEQDSPAVRLAHEYYYATLLISAALAFIGFFSFWRSLGGMIDKDNGLKE